MSSSLRASLVAVSLVAVASLAAGCSSESSDATCYSPSQNLDQAYVAGSRGCGCSSGAVCVPDSTGRKVALVCENGAWQAVEDGPCMQGPPLPGDAGGDAADARADGEGQGDAVGDAGEGG